MLSFLKRFPVTSILCLSLSYAVIADDVAAAPAPKAEFKTNMGSFVIELYPDKAPKTVANFIQYVDDGFYAGTIFLLPVERAWRACWLNYCRVKRIY